jgi:hypothetical protein
MYRLLLEYKFFEALSSIMEKCDFLYISGAHVMLRHFIDHAHMPFEFVKM